jgi:hypothetical protein
VEPGHADDSDHAGPTVIPGRRPILRIVRAPRAPAAARPPTRSAGAGDDTLALVLVHVVRLATDERLIVLVVAAVKEVLLDYTPPELLPEEGENDAAAIAQDTVGACQTSRRRLEHRETA